MSYKRSKTRAIVSFDSQPIASSSSINETDTLVDNNDSSNEETEILISSCIRYILLREYSKHSIKQSDLTKYLSENHTLKRNAVGYILSEVKKRLFHYFGYRMVEINESSTKSFIIHTIYNMREICLDDEDEIVSIYTPDNDAIDDPIDSSHVSYDENDDDSNDMFENDINVGSLTYDEIIENSKRSLLLISLSLIFMNEYPLPEKDLFQSINELGLNMEEKIETCHDGPKHSIKKLLIEEFVRKAYLKRSKIENPSEDAMYEYDWGIRAICEFRKCDILNFVKEIYQMDDSAFWIRFQKKAEEEDSKRNVLIYGDEITQEVNYIPSSDSPLEEIPSQRSLRTQSSQISVAPSSAVKTKLNTQKRKNVPASGTQREILEEINEGIDLGSMQSQINASFNRSQSSGRVTRNRSNSVVQNGDSENEYSINNVTSQQNASGGANKSAKKKRTNLKDDTANTSTKSKKRTKQEVLDQLNESDESENEKINKAVLANKQKSRRRKRI